MNGFIGALARVLDKWLKVYGRTSGRHYLLMIVLSRSHFAHGKRSIDHKNHWQWQTTPLAPPQLRKLSSDRNS